MEIPFQNMFLIACFAAIFYAAYRIGAFILKMANGLAVIGLLLFGSNRIWPYFVLH